MVDATEFNKGKPHCTSHFYDSGSFTQWKASQKWAEDESKRTGKTVDRMLYFDTPEHYAYMDSYAAFLQKYSHAIDLAANVDVIGNAKLTWRNQQYMEKLGAAVVPVVHYGTAGKWLTHYIDAGYPLVALGGLVGSANTDGAQAWIDRMFEIACDNPERTPCVKLHGFGVTSVKLMRRYPWWSVDSSSWAKVAAYGGVLVPRIKADEFRFDLTPLIVKFSSDSPERKKGKHYLSYTKREQKVIRKWMKHIGVPIGSETEDGLVSNYAHRQVANLFFFEAFRASLPEYPWAWTSKRTAGLGLV